MLLSFSTGGMFMKVAATFHPELCTDTTLTSAEKHDTDCKDRANTQGAAKPGQKTVRKNAKSGEKKIQLQTLQASNGSIGRWQQFYI